MTELATALDDALARYRDLVVEWEPRLTALDERSGDGDFGANLREGVTLADSRRHAAGGAESWATLASVFLDDVGGTSGPLFGLLFQRLHAAAGAEHSLDAVLRRGVADGLAAVQRVGEAEVGDRTIVDALVPANRALADGGDSAAAAEAAVDGAIATAGLVARRGRASYVGERAVGFPDPGAVGIALLFVALAQAAGRDEKSALARLTASSDGTETTASANDDAVSAADSTVASATEAVDGAVAARAPLGAMTRDARAALLDALADALDREVDELVAIAQEETHLSAARLTGEVARTSFQLRTFGSLTRDGAFLDVQIDHADAEWPVAPRPDLRRVNHPIGPVLVFAASNFPFAFSVLGGDTASALAAGNPVVVKAHSGHPRLSRRTAEIAVAALREAGAPAGTLTLIEGTDAGLAAIRDPRIKAAGFTGSISGGRALFDIAASRPEPIPFFGELGSTNPVFVTAAADAADAAFIADGFVQSFTLGAGQFCTKPGVLIVPSGSAVLAALQRRTLPPAAPLLNDRILSGFHTRLRELLDAPGAHTLRADGDPFAPEPAPILVRAAAADVLADTALYLDECFGPAALVVEYDSNAELAALADAFGGQLTATVFGSGTETPTELVAALTERAGRLLWRQWPTGVSVTAAQQHGGPYPASTASQTTSVGAAAVSRFLRPVAYQGFPEHLLPRELRESEEGGSPTRV